MEELAYTIRKALHIMYVNGAIPEGGQTPLGLEQIVCDLLLPIADTRGYVKHGALFDLIEERVNK